MKLFIWSATTGIYSDSIKVMIGRASYYIIFHIKSVSLLSCIDVVFVILQYHKTTSWFLLARGFFQLNGITVNRYWNDRPGVMYMKDRQTVKSAFSFVSYYYKKKIIMWKNQCNVLSRYGRRPLQIWAICAFIYRILRIMTNE